MCVAHALREGREVGVAVAGKGELVDGHALLCWQQLQPSCRGVGAGVHKEGRTGRVWGCAVSAAVGAVRNQVASQHHTMGRKGENRAHAHLLSAASRQQRAECVARKGNWRQRVHSTRQSREGRQSRLRVCVVQPSPHFKDKV